MMDLSAQLKIQKHCRNNPLYVPEAFTFILETLEYTVRKHGLGEKEGAERHVHAQQLLIGILDFAKEEYGLLAPVVLKQLGIRKPEDVGEIVFQLIDLGMLKKRPTDKKEDFSGGLTFDTDFDEPIEEIQI